MDSAVRGNLLPLMPALLAEPEPMPLYAQKLLTHLLDASPAWASELQRQVQMATWLSVGGSGLSYSRSCLLLSKLKSCLIPVMTSEAPELQQA